jgi:galactokinase
MVTILVGRKTSSGVCSIVAAVPETDEPRKVEFPVPTKQALLPGSPKWANYVKGVIANFHAVSKNSQTMTKSIAL